MIEYGLYLGFVVSTFVLAIALAALIGCPIALLRGPVGVGLSLGCYGLATGVVSGGALWQALMLWWRNLKLKYRPAFSSELTTR